jgi:hypothetical protein
MKREWLVPISPPDPPLTERQRVRRVAILCRHCLRNIAFYRAGWKRGRVRLRVEREFWSGANGNFVDIAVLEWCKLFTEHKGKHHWKAIVADATAFRKGLRARLGLSGGEFGKYARTVLHYRDKFIAHLDDDLKMRIPILWPARKSAAYLYDHLLSDPALAVHLDDFNQLARDFYRSMYTQAHHEYIAGSEAE